MVGTLADCAALEPSRPILLCGDLVLIDLDVGDPGPGFIRQADRRLSRSATLAVWLRAEAAEAVVGRREVALAVDGYLRWGAAQRAPTLLIAGFAPDTGESNIEAYAFRDGTLILCREAVLSPRADDRFEGEVTTLIDELRGQLPDDHWRVVTAAPLAPIAGIESLGDEPLARLGYRPLKGRREVRPWLRRYALPALLLGVGVALYAAAIGVGLWRYDAAVDTFRAQRPGTETLAVSLDRLDAMRRYLEASATANEGVHAPRPILAAGARLDGVIVESLHLVAHPLPNEPTLVLEFVVPRRGDSGMLQGETLLRQLALSGWDLSINRHRDVMIPVRGTRRPYRRFQLEGRPLPSIR